jgi:hypothetical protein
MFVRTMLGRGLLAAVTLAGRGTLLGRGLLVVVTLAGRGSLVAADLARGLFTRVRLL